MIDAIEDVFFLNPAEYDQSRDRLRRVIEARRAEHRHWSSLAPPADVGNVTSRQDNRDALILGVPASFGAASGVARIILDLADAGRLKPGDVLVTTMTSPAWTPLFSLAAAVVTDSGDALSHVAIAAREYGIPCVVGTNHATTEIIDGATITVNGDEGTVRTNA